MKLGNISQSIVPVPNLFVIQDLKPVDTFYLSKSKSSYFRSKDLFNKSYFLDINRNKNININKILDKINKSKYISINNNNKNLEEKKFSFSSLKNDYFNKNLREDLFNDTYNLLERINEKYDMKRWNEFNHRFYYFDKINKTVYNPLTFRSKDKNYDINDEDKNLKQKFSKTLREKILNLKTINSRTKSFLYKKNIKNICNNDNNNNYINSKLDYLLEKNRENLIKIKKKNSKNNKFIKSNSSYNLFNIKKDLDFLNKNKFMTDRINKDSFIFKDYLSKTRGEFFVKNIIPKERIKNSILNRCNLVNKEKYNFNEKELSNFQNEIWNRPLHKDAFKLNNI